MDDVLTSMRSDPKVVVEFRNIIKAFDKSGKSLAGVDKSLKELGIEVINVLTQNKKILSKNIKRIFYSQNYVT